jgi:Fuc2NAc and GlcNAc transferase
MTIVLLLASFAVAVFLLAIALRYPEILPGVDIPNARSLHERPTLRGGGVVIVVVVQLAVLVLGATGRLRFGEAVALFVSGSLVAAIGFEDDRRGVAPLRRALVHLIAAGWCVSYLHPGSDADALWLRASIWLGSTIWIAWSINFFNFLDGADGYAATEAIFVGAVSSWLMQVADPGWMAIIVCMIGATAAFLMFNWPPARIFLGDVGSGYLGFLLGATAIRGASTGTIPFALSVLLIGVFVFDAVITLGKRVLRRERWWEAHRQHAYQRFVLGERSHEALVYALVAINCVVAACVLLGTVRAQLFAWLCIASAYLLVGQKRSPRSLAE